MYDMNRCPQTVDEFRDYFYALIGRSMGAPADDFEAVLTRLYSWYGQSLMIPPGVGPGIVQSPDAPFYGLTQQFSGVPKARVFLPTVTPDELGYYTRCMQYVDDDPHGSGGLVWAWYLAGPDNAYAPVHGPDEGGDSGHAPSGGGVTEDRVRELIAEAMQDAVQYGQRVALRSCGDSGAGTPPSLLSVDGGGVPNGRPLTFQGRSGDTAGPWESLTVERGQ